MSAQRARAAAAVAAATILLAGCSGGLGQQVGDRTGYIEGTGAFREVPVDERGDPVEITGPTTDGSTLDLAAWRGDVVVVNLWYAGCAPCREEADELVAAAQARAGDGVRFAGLNVRDDAPNAAAFERKYAVPYPSVLDAGSGEGVLALAGLVSPQAIPSTIVLDRQGRPASRVLGQVDPDVLDALIDTALAEDAG